METNWQTKKLGELCEIKPSKSEAKIKLKYKDSVSFVPMGDLGIFSKGFDPKHERQLKDVSGSYTYFADGDVLLAKITPCFENGKIGIANKLRNGIGFGSSEFIVFRSKGQISSDYLYYILSSDNFRNQGIKLMSGAVGHKRVPKEYVENYEISVPPLLEQKRIVKILDEVFEKLENAKQNVEKNLSNSKELFEVYLESVFLRPDKNWEEKVLEEICSIESRLVDPRKKEFLNLVHIGAGNLETRSEKLVDLKTSHEENLISGKFLFDTSMVLYSKIRPYLIKIVRPNFNGLCSADIYPLVPKKELITRDFLFFVLRSKAFTDYAIKGSARAGMPKVNREHLFAYSFCIPPISEQKNIVKKLDQLSEQTKKLESIYQKKMDNIEELKKSILSKAFSKGL